MGSVALPAAEQDFGAGTASPWRARHAYDPAPQRLEVLGEAARAIAQQRGRLAHGLLRVSQVAKQSGAIQWDLVPHGKISWTRK
jgi:hypothetical protein